MEGSGPVPARGFDGGGPPADGLHEGAAFRVPPHNYEAEMALLGALLTNNRAFDRVADFLQAEHFADARHGRIFDAIRKLVEMGQIADPITLKNLFENDGSLDEVGGVDYLARLAASVVTIINAGDYGRTVFDRHLRRALIEIGSDIVNEAYNIDLDLDALRPDRAGRTASPQSGDRRRDAARLHRLHSGAGQRNRPGRSSLQAGRPDHRDRDRPARSRQQTGRPPAIGTGDPGLPPLHG